MFIPSAVSYLSYLIIYFFCLFNSFVNSSIFFSNLLFSLSNSLILFFNFITVLFKLMFVFSNALSNITFFGL